MAMSAKEINKRAAEEIERSAVDLRVGFMRDSLEFTKDLLIKQEVAFDKIASDGYPEGSVFEYWVLEDVVALPFIDGKPQDAITSYMAKDEYGVDDGTKDEMMIFVPVKSGLAVDEHLDIEDIMMPEFVAIKRGFKNGSVAWYIVRQDGVIPYIPEYESGGETMADFFTFDDITDELIHLQLSKQVDTGIGLIGQLREDFVNFKKQVQRKIELSNGKYIEIE